VRYASDKFAPTLYLRKLCKFGGHTLVSEPLDIGDKNWQAVPPNTFLCIEDGEVTSEAFSPV